MEIIRSPSEKDPFFYSKIKIGESVLQQLIAMLRFPYFLFVF